MRWELYQLAPGHCLYLFPGLASYQPGYRYRFKGHRQSDRVALLPPFIALYGIPDD